jgi:hypothetical protein
MQWSKFAKSTRPFHANYRIFPFSKTTGGKPAQQPPPDSIDWLASYATYDELSMPSRATEMPIALAQELTL